MPRCAIWSWNFQNGRRCHGNQKKQKWREKLKVLQIGWNFTERLYMKCRRNFEFKNFQNGGRCHGNGDKRREIRKRAGKLKVLQIEWNFTERLYLKCKIYFGIKNFQNDRRCHGDKKGGKIKSAPNGMKLHRKVVFKVFYMKNKCQCYMDFLSFSRYTKPSHSVYFHL